MLLDKESKGENRVNLTRLNTFGVKAQADCMVRIHAEERLQELLQDLEGPFHILGGGSNILLTKDVGGILLKNEIRGMEVVNRNNHSVIVKIGAGENWHDFVSWCMEQNFGGVENLSLIPGTVGAAPIQNIGAYGVELKDVFHQLSAIRLSDGHRKIFFPADCTFAYRDSIFKNSLKGQYLITHVFLQLTAEDHQIQTGYGAIRNRLLECGIQDPTIQEVSQVITQIRKQKLPDPARLGNAGSFFKNPILTTSHFQELQTKFPDMAFYPAEEGYVKVPAGWLIERGGWKGKRVGNVGCYEQQALVIVNYSDATGAEIWAHAQRVMQSVLDMFGVMLQPEVNVW